MRSNTLTRVSNNPGAVQSLKGRSWNAATSRLSAVHTRETVEALTASPNNPFTHAPTRRVDTPARKQSRSVRSTTARRRR